MVLHFTEKVELFLLEIFGNGVREMVITFSFGGG